MARTWHQESKAKREIFKVMDIKTANIVITQFNERVGICMFDGGLNEDEAKQIAKDEIIQDFGEQVINEIKKYKEEKEDQNNY